MAVLNPQPGQGTPKTVYIGHCHPRNPAAVSPICKIAKPTKAIKAHRCCTMGAKAGVKNQSAIRELTDTRVVRGAGFCPQAGSSVPTVLAFVSSNL